MRSVIYCYRHLVSWLYRLESSIQNIGFAFLAVNCATNFPIFNALILHTSSRQSLHPSVANNTVIYISLDVNVLISIQLSQNVFYCSHHRGIIWDYSGGDTFCRMCGACGSHYLQQRRCVLA